MTDEQIKVAEHVRTTTPDGVNVVISKNSPPVYDDDSKMAAPHVATGDTSLTELAGEKAGDDIHIDGQSISVYKLRPRDLIDFAKIYDATVDTIDALPAAKRAEAQQYLNWLILHRNGYEKLFDVYLDDDEALRLSMKLVEQMEVQGFLPTALTGTVTGKASA